MNHKFRMIENEFGATEFLIKKWWFPFWITQVADSMEEDENGNRITVKGKKMGQIFTSVAQYEKWKVAGSPKPKKIIRVIQEW